MYNLSCLEKDEKSDNKAILLSTIQEIVGLFSKFINQIVEVTYD